MEKNQEARKALKDLVFENEHGSHEILCSAALEIARDYKLDSRQIKKILDEEKIRIVSCQLGCFS